MVIKQDQYSYQVFTMLFCFCIVLLLEYLLSPIAPVGRLRAICCSVMPDKRDTNKHLTSKAHHSLVSTIGK